MPPSIDDIKKAWLDDGWFRVSVRNSESGDRLLISGFLYPPKSGASQRLGLSGDLDPEVQYGLFNGDYAYLGSNAFETSIEPRSLDRRDVLSMSAVADTEADAIPWHQSWHLLPPDDLAFPPGPNQQRISQKAIDDHWFYFSGGTFVHKLSAILNRYFSTEITEAESVLDWGCGCARLTRHLSKYTSAEIHGIDIDPQNIEWCADNLPGASFSLVDPWKPLVFEDESFEFIVGHSVLTHLTEEAQRFWLDELCRVLKPGGALLVTVMSSLSALCDRLSDAEIHDLLRAGFLDVGHQADGVDVVDPGYYRKVYHRPEYIRENWSSQFEILDILEGYADHQALVVCKKT